MNTGDPCPPVENMGFLTSDSSTPYDWDIPGANIGKTIWYRVAWETERYERSAPSGRGYERSAVGHDGSPSHAPA